MKGVTFLIAAFVFSLLLNSCNTTEPPPPDGDEPTLELQLEDVSCIEAWIKLTTTNLQLPTTITLKQTNPTSDTKSYILNLNTQDSLLYIDSLLPNKNYLYQVSSIQHQVSSNELSVTTMDTTSHNFTFETFTFGGEAGSCALYDVAIINENYIIAVGTIFLNDSLGQPDPQPYGVAIWEGQNWELKKIFHSTNIPVTPRGISVIGPNEIYLAAGSIFRWDGISSTVEMVFSRLSFPDPNATIEKLWGSSNSSIYGVGNAGSIVFFNGTTWQRIESGTDISLSDVYGNNSNEIFISGADNVNVKGIILKKSGSNGVSTLITSEIITENQLFDKLFGSLSSVWLDEKNTLYTGGNILFCYRFNRWDYVRSMPENYIGGNPNVYYRGFIHSIRGNTSNDYFVVGDRNTVRHFNGVTWQQIGFPYDPNSYRIWRSVCVKDNVCIIVGDNINNASIMIIKK